MKNIIFLFFISSFFLQTLHATNTTYHDNNQSKALTHKEKLWIKRHPIVTVGGGPDWAPFDFVNSEGNYDGIANDYLNLISAKTGLKFKVVVDKWSNNLQKMKENKIDLLHAVYFTQQRAKYMQFTKPYFEMLDYFFIRDDLEVKTLKDLEGKRVAIPKGYAHKEILKKEFPNIKIVTVDTFSEAIETVLENRADSLFDTYASLSYVLKKSGISTIIPFKAYRGNHAVKLHMATQKENPILSSIIDKALSKITKEEKETIYNKWLSPKEEKELLTSQEKTWLFQNPMATFAGNTDRVPYIATDKKNNCIGIVADYLHEIQKKIPITFNPNMVQNFKELKELIENKRIDIIAGDKENPYLAKNYRPISSDFKAPIVILMKDNNAFINNLEDIKNLKIALLNIQSYNDKIYKKYPSIPFIKVNDAQKALQDLSMGHYDALLMSMPEAGYYIKANGFQNIKIVGKTDVVFALTLFITKDKPLLHQIIEKTRASISELKSMAIIGKWQKVEFAEKTNYTLLFQIAGLLLLFLLATLYWNRKLSLEVKKRKEVETQLQTLIDNIPLQIIVTSYEGKILMANPQTLKDHGLSKEDMQTYNMSQFYASTKDRDAVMHTLHTEGSINQKIIKFKHIDNSTYDMMVSILPISYKKKHAILSIAVDMRERLEMEKALSLAKEEAEYANLAKSEFLANMSHEIRTPMNSVLGFAELLAKQISDPIQKDYLNAIQRGGETLLHIISDILDLSKIESGKLEIIPERVDMKQLAFEIESLFSIELIQKNIHFELNIDPSLPRYLLLDSTRVRQILINLIGNAIKFTSHGFVKLGIQKVFEDREKSKINLQISVQDSGIGIPTENIEHIFDDFEQQKGQDNQKYGGTGLGLAICKKLSFMMNGTITAESEVGVGSTFTVTLSDISVSSIKSRDPKKRKKLGNVHFDKATVLVVDDIKENRKLVLATLYEHDLEAIEAENGQEAIDLLRTISIDLIFMDIKMPVMNGYTATQIIKSDERLQKIPVIALTASVLGEDFEKIKGCHFDGYLRKPVSQEDLLMQMKQYLTHDTVALSTDKKNDIDTNTYENLPEVIHTLETTYHDRWEEIKEKGDFTLIANFGESLEILGNENGINLLSHYAKELKINCESFDIDRMDFLMNSYTSMIKKLKGIKCLCKKC